MPLTLEQQADVAIRSLAHGDIDLLTSMMTDPNTVSVDEQRTVAESLGFKRGFLSAAINTVADPVVWMSWYMSRLFPFQGWLRGTIPKQFIGGANEFSGLSAFTRHIEGFFRGTNVPRMNALAVRREAEVMKEGSKIFDIMLSRKNWKEEMPVVSLLLEGQHPPGATAELVRVKDQIRTHMENLWGFLNKTQKIDGGLLTDGRNISFATAGPFDRSTAPRHLRDYLPHIPLATNETIIETSADKALQRMYSAKHLQQALQQRGVDLASVWTPTKADSFASDFSRVQGFMGTVGAEVINPRLFRRSREFIPLQSSLGQELFVTDLNLILEKYVRGVAKTYAIGAPISDHERTLVWGKGEGWQFPTNEPLIVQIVNEGLRATGAKTRQYQIAGTQIWKENVIPGSFNIMSMEGLKNIVRNLQGLRTADEILWGNTFASIRKNVDDSLGNLIGRNSKAMGKLDQSLLSLEKTENYRSLSNRVTGHFYASTLGLNIGSSLKNLFQPILTTMPAIGIGPTLKGYKVLAERMPTYAREFMNERRRFRDAGVDWQASANEALHSAFNKAFPELERTGVRLDPRAFDVSEEALMSRGILQHGAFRKLDDFYKLLLQPFTHAEVANQVSTFYGAKEAFRNSINVGEMQIGNTPAHLVDDALNFEAANVVNASQFRAGPGSRSIVQSYLPGPLRMFTSFPTRLLSFMGESTVRGAMTQEAINQARVVDWVKDPFLTSEAARAGGQKLFSMGTGRNLGTLSRMVLYGRVVNNGLRDVLGVDLSGALGIAAPFVNLAPPDQPFAPLPFPPIAGAVTGILSAASTRDIKRLQPLTLPVLGEVPIPKTLFPGGLAISRFVRAMNQYRPDLGGFVDDDERFMYQGNTTDMLLTGLGVPLEKGRRLRDAMDKMYANRTAIRRMRREFATGAMSADYARMDKVSAQWQQAFPDMPPISLTPKDLKRYQQSASIPLVSRMIDTLGKGMSYLKQDIYEYDPELVTPPAFPMFMGAA